jgi:hypothetical protein
MQIGRALLENRTSPELLNYAVVLFGFLAYSWKCTVTEGNIKAIRQFLMDVFEAGVEFQDAVLLSAAITFHAIFADDLLEINPFVDPVWTTCAACRG